MMAPDAVVARNRVGASNRVGENRVGEVTGRSTSGMARGLAS